MRNQWQHFNAEQLAGLTFHPNQVKGNRGNVPAREGDNAACLWCSSRPPLSQSSAEDWLLLRFTFSHIDAVYLMAGGGGGFKSRRLQGLPDDLMNNRK